MFDFISPLLYLGVHGDKPSEVNTPHNDSSSDPANNDTGGSVGGGTHIVYTLISLRYIIVLS